NGRMQAGARGSRGFALPSLCSLSAAHGVSRPCALARLVTRIRVFSADNMKRFAALGGAAALIVAITVAAAAWLLVPKGNDPASALRDRLLGLDSRAVERVLGPPTFRDAADKTWQYMDDRLIARFADPSVANKTLVVQFDAEDSVASVYLTD